MTGDDGDKVIEIYKNYYGMMMYVASQTLGDKKDAAPDMVHDTILKIIDKLDVLDLSDDYKTRSLCALVVRNKCLDYLEKKDTNNVSLDEVNVIKETTLSAEDIVVSEENIKAVMRAIDSLGEKSREVCRMKFVHGYRDNEIAEILDIAPGTVRSRINYARKILANILKEGGTNE